MVRVTACALSLSAAGRLRQRAAAGAGGRADRAAAGDSILRLEDQRVLRDPAPPPPAPAVEPAARRGRAVALPPPPPVPDLTTLLGDGSARTRRRAALAMGRVGLADGVAPLLARLASDAEVEVRQMSAFALGLLGPPRSDHAASSRAGRRLAVVRGRAAEALGLIGDTGSAAAIGAMVAAYVKAGALSSVVADESGYPLTRRDRGDAPGPLRARASEGVRAAGGRGARRRGRAGHALVAGGVCLPTRRRPQGGARACARLHKAMASTPGRLRPGVSARSRIAAPSICSRSLAANTPSSPIVGVEAIRALADIADPRALPTLVDLLRVRGLHRRAAGRDRPGDRRPPYPGER